MEVGMRFGVSQDAVRRVVADAGATIRPKGLRREASARERCPR